MKSNPFRWLGALVFTVLVPGTVTVVLPYLILDRSFRSNHGLGLAPHAFGLLLLLCGFGIYFRCLWDFVIAGRGIPSPVDHPKFLVVRGLYRYVRNPMYLGVLAILLGEVVVFLSPILLGYTALWLLIVHFVVLLYEEPNLEFRFGTSYEHYCQHVRRWIPGSPYQTSER